MSKLRRAAGLLMKRSVVALLALSTLPLLASASGPVAPQGWNGSFGTTLPRGQACCMPADLNGANLTGGAFVLLSDDKKEFAVFALTYAAAKGQPKPKWDLLESHSAEKLSNYEIKLAPTMSNENLGVSVCEARKGCRHYFWNPASKKFTKTKVPLQ